MVIARVYKKNNAYTMVWRNTAVTCFSRDEVTELLTTTIESQMSPPDVVLYWDESNNCSLHSVLEFLPPGPLVERYSRENPSASARIIENSRLPSRFKRSPDSPTFSNATLIERVLNFLKGWCQNDTK